MRNKVLVAVGAIVVLIGVQIALPVFADEIPQFPHCLNPKGAIRASYTSGIHGIAGDPQTYSGSDIVYDLSDSSHIQCMCSTTGAGIQTNWIQSFSVSDSTRASLISQGWIVIPDGTPWGLQPQEYLAFNSFYSCVGGSGGGDPGTSSNGGSNSSSGQSSSSSSSSSSNNTASSMVSQILASTGTTQRMSIYTLLGIIFIVSGISLSIRNNT